ncbi:hypothetical protein RclHR1_15840008, partial [Rhizophagus clarus]
MTQQLNEVETSTLFERLVKTGNQEKVKELIKKYYEKNDIGEGSSQDYRINKLELEKKALIKEIDELLKEPKPDVQIESTKEELSEDKGGLEHLLNEVKILTVDRTKKEKEIISLEEKIKKLENIVKTSYDPKRISELQRKMEDLRGKLAIKKTELSNAREKLVKKDDSVRKQIADLKGKIDSLQNTVRGLESEKKRNKSSKKESKLQLDKTRIDESEHKLKEISELVLQTQKAKRELEKMIEESKIKLDGDKKNRIKELFERQEENDDSELEEIKFLLSRKLDNKVI